MAEDLPAQPTDEETACPQDVDLPALTDPAAWRERIEQAARRLDAHLRPTPLVHSRHLSTKIGRPVWLKLESLQPTGAFKVRAAFNSILSDLEANRASGVVTNSSGNFAQAVAYAATALEVESTIVMMRSASPFKRERTERFGGRVAVCEDSFAARAEMTDRIAAESGRRRVHPFDTAETIAGNGTLGRELLAQIDGEFEVYVPISGGGLISGTTLAVMDGRPGCRVIGVQATANPAMRRSLDAGRRIRSNPAPSLADALTVPRPGRLTFPIISRLVKRVDLVEEHAMASSIRTLAIEEKLVVEAGAAVTVAAALAAESNSQPIPVVCVLSGGNIDPATLQAILAAGN